MAKTQLSFRGSQHWSLMPSDIKISPGLRSKKVHRIFCQLLLISHRTNSIKCCNFITLLFLQYIQWLASCFVKVTELQLHGKKVTKLQLPF